MHRVHLCYKMRKCILMSAPHMNKKERAERSESRQRIQRRRGSALESAILEAAWAVLIEAGYEGFTFEAIAERAQTSRPVIHRRWPQREALLLATVSEHWRTHPIEMPNTGNLRDDAVSFLRNANSSRASMMALIGAQLITYFRHTGSNFDELRTSLRRREGDAFEILLNRAIERREIAELPKSSRIVNLPFDLLRHDIYMTFRAVPDESILEIVDELWLPLLNISIPGGFKHP